MSVQNGLAGQVYKARVHLVEVVTQSDARNDRAIDWVEERIKAAGHAVVGREVAAEAQQISQALTNQAGNADLVIFVGGVGLGPGVPEAIGSMLESTYPGFGDLLRTSLNAESGSSLLWCRPVAGLYGSLAVFAVPGTVSACRAALDQLILPELARMLTYTGGGGAPDADAPKPLPATRIVPTPSPERGASSSTSDEVAASPGRGVTPDGVSVNLGSPESLGAVSGDMGAPTTGWRAAIAALEGEMLPTGERVPLPEPLERLSPVVNVLHTAGQLGGFKTPSGKKYGLYGWPDLNRPSSKVIAVADGHPWGSALALHRFPVPSGLCSHVESWVPSFRGSVQDACAQLSDRMPKDLSGELFAVQGNAVWIRQGGRIMMWDGRHMKSEGTEKQALAWLFLHWSQK